VPIDTKLRSTRESNGLGGEMNGVDLGLGDAKKLRVGEQKSKTCLS
jgi:hypothetical protein